MTAPSEQEWRNAVSRSLLDLLEVVEDDVEASEVRLTVDAVLAAIAPLRELERLSTIVGVIAEYRAAVEPEIMDSYHRGRQDALRAALTTFEHIGDARAAELLRGVIDVNAAARSASVDAGEQL